MKYTYFILIFLIGLCQACIDRIDLASPSGQSDAIVVQGSLVISDNSYIEVSVTKLFAFDGSGTFVNVSGVNLILEEGESISLVKISEGVYSLDLSDTNINSDLESRYKIEVNLFDGTIIESAYESFGFIEATNELEFNIEEKEVFNERTDRFEISKKAVLTLNAQIDDNQDNEGALLWFVNRYYKLKDSPESYGIAGFAGLNPRKNSLCYIKEQVGVKTATVDKGSNFGGGIMSFKTQLYEGTINDYRFSDTMYFTVNQQVLSPGATDYFENINSLLSRTGSMFEPPAGQVPSNLTNLTNPEKDVFGYFYVTSSAQEESRILVLPEQFGDDVPPPLCPVSPGEGWTFGDCPFTDCCDCTEIDGSTQRKPDFWIN